MWLTPPLGKINSSLKEIGLYSNPYHVLRECSNSVSHGRPQLRPRLHNVSLPRRDAIHFISMVFRRFIHFLSFSLCVPCCALPAWFCNKSGEHVDLRSTNVFLSDKQLTHGCYFSSTVDSTSVKLVFSLV